MACYHPSTVTIGRKSLARVGASVADRVTVPCGSCLGCRSDQARGWAVRLVHEGMTSGPAWFATLTYRPEDLPEYGSLFPRDFTLCMKRLRESEAGLGRRFSYYVAGEYGDENARPHFHAALFGPGFHDREFFKDRNGAPCYSCESLEGAWKKGFCEITGLTYAGARYVASYVRKKVRQRDNPEHYTRVDPATGELVELQREFGRMSRRPAIGRRFIEQYWRDVYPRDFVVMEGFPLKPPRYYDKYMDLSDEEGGSEERRQIMMEVREQRIKDIVEFSDEELIMKEKVHRAKVDLFQRRDGV